MPASTLPYTLPSRDYAWQMQRAAALLDEMNGRRSCRFFSDRPVPRELIESALAVAHTAPSGANRRPWRFVAIDDPALKREIRIAAEAEEKESYEHRMPPEWLDALEPIGTDWRKPFLEIAPWLVVVFRVDWEEAQGRRVKNYYPSESTGIASGFFLMAAHMLGLATLTHTPSPMGFLREICRRPEGEKPYLLIPAGYPADDATVPDLVRKPLAAVLQWNRGDARAAGP
ncbi:NADH dehydrogenase [Phycisphaerae bacterium RAS1]|nr:NADH dehydrogenase [Phycisphaerae bacterium RAS1]